MDKAKYSLENHYFSLWPKLSDNENLLSAKTGENIGVKWKPIRTSVWANKKKEAAVVYPSVAQ